MATDKSEPNVGLIIGVAISSIITLIAVRLALGAYFDSEARAEEFRKIGSQKPEALMSVRADEASRLANGPMSIDSAMSDLASHGRMGVGPEIMPSATRDVAPLQGWAKLPLEAPAAMLAPLPEADAGADAGAALVHSHKAPTAAPAPSAAPKKTP